MLKYTIERKITYREKNTRYAKNYKWSIMFYRGGEFYWKPCYMYCSHMKRYAWTFDGAWLWFEVSIAKSINTVKL